jgi:hypothetical protein
MLTRVTLLYVVPASICSAVMCRPCSRVILLQSSEVGSFRLRYYSNPTNALLSTSRSTLILGIDQAQRSF